MKTALIVGALATIAGCASLNESECRTADWHMIGYEDGARGQSTSRIGEHRSACADYGVVPDYLAYKAGHAEGVHEYCTPENGFTLGKGGGHYNRICPGNLEHGFLDGFELGREHYAITSMINQYRSTINGSHSRIKKLQKKVRNKESVIISDETTEKRRGELLAQIKEHQQEIGELKSKILEMEKLKAVKEAEYSHLEQPIFY